jgi:NRPS condensation-like uncharacterized protein
VKRFPLTWQDQAILDLENAADPWNVQFEIAGTDRLDVPRLEQALLRACSRHPLARSRLVRGNAFSSTNYWQPQEIEHFPVAVREIHSEDDLDRLRTALYSARFDLTSAPPLEAVVARADDLDVLMVKAAHPAVDGTGLLRFLSSAAAYYRGQNDPADLVALDEARALPRLLRAASAEEVLGRGLEGGRKLSDAVRAPARVARDSADPRKAAGFAHRRLDPDQTGRIIRDKPAGVTVNDMVLAATCLAIERWNREHEEPADKIQLFMPVNVRRPEWSADVVSNLVSYVSVSTTAGQRPDLRTAAVAVSRQTGPFRRSVRSGGTQDLLRMLGPVPLGIKRVMPHLLSLTGGRLVDSAVVSNLGKPAQVPSFTGQPPSDLYFTPPYWSAAAVAVGVITSSDSLHLGVRHRLQTLDAAAGRRFTDLLVSCLTDAGT